MVYRACTEDYEYILKHVVNYDLVFNTKKYSEASHETVSAVLVEAGRMCEEKLSPLQRMGDLNPATLQNGVVRTSPGLAMVIKLLLRVAGYQHLKTQNMVGWDCL